MVIENLPQSITRDAYMALLAGAGFTDMTTLRELMFRPDGIYAVAFVLGEGGGVQPDTMTGELLAHRVYIPVEG